MSRRTPLEQKLGTFIRMLASERDGEVVAAARAIVRTLKAAGADIHVLAEHGPDDFRNVDGTGTRSRASACAPWRFTQPVG
jgi:hypothetical protein